MADKPKIELPFDPRRKKNSDWGEWVYEHRTTLMVSLIVYLLFGIAIIGWRISVNSNQHIGVIEVQFEDLDRLKQEYDRQIEINRALTSAGGRVSNAVSNEAGELNDALRDDRGTDAQQLYDDANAVQERLQMGGIEYNEARSQQATNRRDNSNTNSSQNGGYGATTRKGGDVTISYSLYNPVRSGSKMITPSYQCEGGGEVMLDIVVNKNGDVVSASLNSGNGDDCMVSAALAAARGSRFNADSSAPDRQTGTITYIFIPQ